MNKTNILDHLEETSRIYPDKTALSGGGVSLTFSELYSRAGAVGSFLIARGFRRQAVLVLMDKHPDTVCAFLGVLNSGCFYVCVDPDFPDVRIRDIAEKCQAAAVICNMGSLERARLLYGRADIFLFEEMAEHIIDEESLLLVRNSVIDTEPAYIVFTSGSTGEAKGVCASHRSLVDYADALCSTLGFDRDTVFGNQAPLYYDAPLKELLPVLCLGASLVFIPRELFMFPIRLCEFIKDNGINTLCWAASAFSLVSSLGALDLVDMSHLRLVCFGSEVFPLGDYKKWRSACPCAVFINLYGPTEATGMSAYWIADREICDGEPIPIGRAFPNTEIFLLDKDGRRALEGEIYIRGSSLSLGYFGDRESTGEYFVQNPLQSAYPEIVYRTGDIARYNERGELIYLGRADSQIKVMGRRIEPYEVERAACECEGVLFSALMLDSDRSKTVLFYVGDVEERVLLSFLSLRLPRYMLPARCIRLDGMPKKENGKLDRAMLTRLLEENEDRREYYAKA